MAVQAAAAFRVCRDRLDVARSRRSTASARSSAAASTATSLRSSRRSTSNDGYARWDLRGSYRITPVFSILGAIDNLTDTEYHGAARLPCARPRRARRRPRHVLSHPVDDHFANRSSQRPRRYAESAIGGWHLPREGASHLSSGGLLERGQGLLHRAPPDARKVRRRIDVDDVR